MSYDLHFVPSQAGSEPDAVLAFLERHEEEERDGSVPPDEKLAAALQRLNPALARSELDHDEIARFEQITVEEARRLYSHIELNSTEDQNGIQIVLFPNQASITVPYWHLGAKADGIFSEVESYARVLVREAGYRIFDPQLERVVDSLDEIRAEILQQYAGVARRIPQITASDSKKPWWRFW